MKAQKKKTQDCFTDISENEHAAKVKKESQNNQRKSKKNKKNFSGIKREHRQRVNNEK
jgi:hypothetical protein